MGSISPPYQTEEAARKYLESLLWPDGPFCALCPLHGEVTKLNRQEATETHGRKGLYQCRQCRKQFTVTVGTIFEDSRIPLDKWLLAIHLMCSSKKGVSALRLQGELKLGSYRSAWFLCRRMRWAMAQSPMTEAIKKVIGTSEGATYLRRNLHIPLADAEAVRLLLKVKRNETMPRKRQQKSLWSEVNDELHQPKK